MLRTAEFALGTARRLMPGSALPVYGIMAAGFAYCAWLALRASLLEDNVGHRYIALAYATYPLLFALYVALPSWLAHFEMGYYAAVPAMIVGMMIVAVSLIRSSQRTEVELRCRVAAEESLRLLNVTLEDRVASRTGELHDLVSGLESFNRSVSHDLLELSKAADAPLRLGNHELRRCVDEAIAAAVGADGRGTAACTAAAVAGAALYVEDNGMGLPPGREADLFKPFGRLHGDQVPGNGIGLTIVRRIVEAHGGRIWAESPASGGARFLFTIDGLTP